MKKKLSIKDLARELNISATSVSFILNGKAKEKRISEELVKKVEQYAAKTGYKPNSLARSLRTGKSNIIGLMVENISNPFFANIARFIEEKAYKSGYKIIYCSTDNDPEKTRDLIQMYRERHVDGYIITPPEGIEEDVTALIAAGSPVVLFDRHLPGVEEDFVVINNEESTYNATKHLLDHGYRQIGFVTLSSLQSQMQDRLSGYERALKEMKLQRHIKELPYTGDMAGLTRHITAFLKRHPELDAVLFGTNYLGVSGIKAINAIGRRIPEDLAVISFDDHDVFELNTPSITAIAQPIEEIAEKLITTLLGKLNRTNKGKPKDIVLPAKLLVRNSTGVKSGSLKTEK
ncbi:MAG: LacI family transcriptional regulator [Chitinophagaceae bacterium]|nr:MAG: LacI family transcriptional regulator [Chitinophagaceae bacterium]